MYFTAQGAKNTNYVCAALTLFILFSRMVVARWHRRPIDTSFFLVIASIVVDTARLVVNCIYLRDGTASDALHHAQYFNTHDLARIKTGTILSLVARSLITASCWLQIGLMLLFYSRMLSNIRWVRTLIKICWLLTIITFIAVILLVFLECQPFHLYWQISPDPGSCVQAYAQLLMQAISNIVIDLVLLVIAFPLLRCKRTWTEHLRVGVLYTLGVFCIIVTTLRLVWVFASGSAQPTRSFWASLQMLVSTFVANVPTIYGDLHARRRKKSEAALRRQSTTLTASSSDQSCYFGGKPEFSSLEKSSVMSPVSSKTREWFDQDENLRLSLHCPV